MHQTGFDCARRDIQCDGHLRHGKILQIKQVDGGTLVTPGRADGAPPPSLTVLPGRS